MPNGKALAFLGFINYTAPPRDDIKFLPDLGVEVEWDVADSVTSLARLATVDADFRSALSADRAAYADLLCRLDIMRTLALTEIYAELRLEQLHNVADILALVGRWEEEQIADISADLTRGEEAAYDLVAQLRSLKVKGADALARVAVAQSAVHDLLASLRAAREKRVADVAANLAEVVELAADSLAVLAQEATARADSVGALFVEALAHADVAATLAALQQAWTDIAVYASALREGAAGDILALARLVRDFGAADVLTTAAMFADLLAAADTVGNLIVHQTKGADTIAPMRLWQTVAGQTDLLSPFALFRPRWVYEQSFGGPRHDIHLRAFFDPLPGNERVPPFGGKILAFRSRAEWSGDELGWGIDVLADLSISPAWRWKHARAQLRGALQWRIHDIARWDAQIDLAQRRFYRRLANLRALFSLWRGERYAVRLEASDEDWNAGEIVHLEVEDGAVRIPARGGGKALTFYGDAHRNTTRSGFALLPRSFGVRVSPPMDLSVVGNVQASYLRWGAAAPRQSSVTIEAMVTDGEEPTAWMLAENGGAIPGVEPGMDLGGKVLWLRQTLRGQGRTITPQLDWLFVFAASPGAAGGDLRTALGKHVPKEDQIRSQIEMLARSGDRRILCRLVVTEALLREADRGILSREELAELLEREWGV